MSAPMTPLNSGQQTILDEWFPQVAKSKGVKRIDRTCSPPKQVLNAITFRSPDSKRVLSESLERVKKEEYKKHTAALRQTVMITYKIKLPSADSLDQISAAGMDWEEVKELLINQLPYECIIERDRANELQAGLALRDTIDHRCLTVWRKKHLRKFKSTQPLSVGLSPGIGLFSNFVQFFRKRFKITPGRNVSIAIARWPQSNELIYTLASTDGPPGGSHSELIAWDLLPELVKDVKRGLIFTERQPCCSGSNCEAKLRAAFHGGDVRIVYTMPLLKEGARFSFLSFKNVHEGVQPIQSSPSSVDLHASQASLCASPGHSSSGSETSYDVSVELENSQTDGVDGLNQDSVSCFLDEPVFQDSRLAKAPGAE